MTTPEQYSELVERAFKNGIAYATNVEVRDVEQAWQSSRVRADLAFLEGREDGSPDADECIDRLNSLCEEFGCAPGSDRLHWLQERLSELARLRIALTMPDAKRRQWFISDRLAKRLHFNRADICDAFGVSVPQASADIKAWLKAHPGDAVYNKSSKRYEAALSPSQEPVNTTTDETGTWSDGGKSWDPAGGPVAQASEWRCFHCDEVFTDPHAARLHFGADESAAPACLIKGSEGGLVEALRRAEKDAADAWHAIHNETTDAAKGFHAQAARHQEQLRAVEQVGYDRGIADAKAHPETLGLMAISAPLTEADGNTRPGFYAALDALQLLEHLPPILRVSQPGSGSFARCSREFVLNQVAAIMSGGGAVIIEDDAVASLRPVGGSAS